MPFRTIDDANFLGGVNKELPSWALPAGTLADASNMIFDVPGMARQRNGSTALSSPATTAFSTAIGWVFSQDGSSVIEQLYGFDLKNGIVYAVNTTTGATTSLGAVANFSFFSSRAARHFGFLLCPGSTAAGGGGNTTVAGQSVATATFQNTANATTVANSPTITLSGADVTTTNIKVGGIGTAIIAAGPAQLHYFRVISITDATHFKVWPAPPLGAVVAATGLTIMGAWTTDAHRAAASFQNRVLMANGYDAITTTFYDRRLWYGGLPTETLTSTNGTFLSSGAHWVNKQSWPALNYFDVPGADPVVALETVSDNELLILTTQGVVILRGNLVTQTSTSAPGITFDVSPLNTNMGCLADTSVQRTPHGIIWASAEGIALYTGGGRTPIDLTAGKYHTAWRTLTRGSSFAVHGSFFARNHYVVSGISGGTTFSLCFNLDNQTWAPLTGAGTDIMYGVPRPTDPSQVFVSRWWDQAGAAPSQTGGHIVRVDSLFAPDLTGQTKTDSDGSAVAFSVTTRAATDDLQSQRFLRRAAARYAATHTAFANITLAAGSRLDTTDTSGTPTVSLGNLSNTSVLTITGQSNATPIVITTSTNHGLQSGDEVDIRGVTTNSNANGHWRITVISVTTFSLNGSVGNGATTSTGTCKKVTEQELDGGAADPGQANYLVVASAGTVNKFEWHGMRLGVMEMPRGMARG